MTLTTDRWPDDTSLRPAYPALPLFGWTLLAAIGQMLIVRGATSGTRRARPSSC